VNLAARFRLTCLWVTSIQLQFSITTHGVRDAQLLVVHDSISTRLRRVRLIAYVCLFFFTLSAALIGPLHTHHGSASSEAKCLVCHSANRAIVVPMAVAAGKPLHNPPVAILPLREAAVARAGNAVRKSPRAPPSFAWFV